LRHATEFTGIDVELAWIDGVEDVMAFEEGMLAHAIGKVAERHGNAIGERFDVAVTVPSVPFPGHDGGRDPDPARQRLGCAT
jgi:aspartyl/asparaginyl-tRNA synthetase